MEDCDQVDFLVEEARALPLDKAAPKLIRIVEQHPDHLPAYRALVEKLLRASLPARALPYAQAAVRLNPNDAASVLDLGTVFLRLGKPGFAAQWFEEAVRLHPTSEAFSSLGAALHHSGAGDRATLAFRRAAELEKNPVKKAILQGHFCMREGKRPEARSFFEAAAQADPECSEALRLLAALSKADGKIEDAIQYLTRAVEADPANGATQVELGHLCEVLGRFEQARRHFQDAVTTDPRNARGYYCLARLSKMRSKDDLLLRVMTGILDRGWLCHDDERDLNFAIGKAYDDTGDFQRAMVHFDRAHELARTSASSAPERFDGEAYVSLVEAAMARFSPRVLADPGLSRSLDPTPVLIVGFPRSGTTLVEQILSCHPELGSAGELSFWSKHSQTVERAIEGGAAEKEAASKVSHAYLRLLRNAAPGRERVIDKMPSNFVALGAVHALFPGAKLIHCRRRPVSSGVSLYTTLFEAFPPMAHSKSDIVLAYRHYHRLMKHWRTVLPSETLIEVDYERLIEDPEQETRRLIRFLNLEWDEKCLRHDLNTRSVRTASFWQVRQPIYRTSADRWRGYEPWLGELAELRELTPG